MTTPREAVLADLRQSIDSLPERTRRAMLSGLGSNTVITGAFTDGSGVCPMLAAHREGDRARWDPIIEAMEDSPVRRLLIYSEREASGLIRITVADSGPGLAPDVAEHLFEAFRSTKESGMGLGLSISASIVAAHGGRIWAEPSKLGGTAFHFTVIDADSEEAQA